VGLFGDAALPGSPPDGHAVDMRVHGMHMEIAKARGEVALGARVQILIFEEQDVTFSERRAQSVNDALGQWS
jgi:hypothetical protein